MRDVAPCFYITFLYYSLDFSENLHFQKMIIYAFHPVLQLLLRKALLLQRLSIRSFLTPPT